MSEGEREREGEKGGVVSFILEEWVALMSSWEPPCRQGWDRSGVVVRWQGGRVKGGAREERGPRSRTTQERVSPLKSVTTSLVVYPCVCLFAAKKSSCLVCLLLAYTIRLLVHVAV